MQSVASVCLLLVLLLNGVEAFVKRDLSVCNKTDDSIPAICYAHYNDPVVQVHLPQVVSQQIFQHSQPVFRVWIKFEQYLFSHCTAWLLGNEGHVMTNKHCCEDAEKATQLRFEIGAQSSSNCSDQCNTGKMPCRGNFINESLTFITTGSSEDMDYTLLQLPKAYRKQLVNQYGYMRLRSSGPVVNERIYVPQHPLGVGKRISISNTYPNGTMKFNTIIQTNAPGFNKCGKHVVTHDADTKSGASGSPILGLKDHLVCALHHCGGCDTTGKNGGIPSNKLIEDLGIHLPNCALDTDKNCQANCS